MTTFLRRIPRFEQFTLGWQLLSARERRTALFLSIFVVFGSGLEMVAISSIVPLLGVVVAPDIWLNKPLLAGMKDLLGVASAKTFVFLLFASVMALLTFAAISSIALRYVINNFGAHARNRLAGALASACADAPYVWFLQHNPAVVARQINIDVMRWGTDFVGRILSVAQTLALCVFAAALVLLFAPFAGAIALAMVAVVVMLMTRLMQARMMRYTQLEKTNSDITTVGILQLISGIKDIKVSARSAYFVDIFRHAYAVICSVQAKRGTLRQVSPVLILFLGQSILVVMVLALWAIGEHPARIAEQVAFLALAASRLVPAANRFFADLSVLWDVFPYTKSIWELRKALEASPRGGSKGNRERLPDPAWKEVRFQDVCFAYPDTTSRSLSSVNLSFERWRSYGIVGPSGAGKTTLVDILLGLLDPTDGAVFLDDAPLNRVNPTAWHERVGYVAQQPFLTDDTLVANIAFGVPLEMVDLAHVRTCLSLANLEDMVANLPAGLDTRLGDRGYKLSGGQRQRVAIARALYKRPDILIFDEATSALDTISEKAIQAAIAKLHGRLTTIVIAHRLSTVRSCDELFLLDGGRIVGAGTFDELLATSTLFQALAATTEHDSIEAG